MGTLDTRSVVTRSRAHDPGVCTEAAVPPPAPRSVLARFAKDLFLGAAVAAALMVVTGWGPSRLTRREATPAAHAAEVAAHRAVLRPAIRETLAAEVRWARPGASLDERRAQRESIASLFAARAGVALSDDLWARLDEWDARVLRGEAPRVKLDDLADAAVAVAVDRVARLTDEEIERAADGFGNLHRTGPVRRLSEESRRQLAAGKRLDPSELEYVPVPDAPLPRAGVMLRYGGRGMMDAEEFVARAKEVRAQLATAKGRILATQFGPDLARELLDERADLWSDALPDATTEGLTPAQALLLCYSVLADDRLDWSTAHLRERVRDTAPVPVPEGTPAFGSRGALFRTPLDMAFERDTLAALVDRLERGGAR